MIEYVNQLRLQQGSKAKKAYLKQVMDENPIFKQCVFYMYNTHYNYYISEESIDNVIDSNNVVENEELTATIEEGFNLLNLLRSRELSGHHAQNTVVDYLFRLPKNDREFFKLIFARSLKSGIDVKSVLECSPGLVPYTPYMRCDLLNDKTKDNLRIDINGAAFAQLKADGEFVNCIVDKEDDLLKVKFITRDGFIKDNFTSEKINVELNKLYNMYNQPIVVMGELLIKGIDNRAVSNGIFNRDVIDESIVDDIFILIWDVIPFISWSSKSYKEDYIQRFESIENSGISQITLEDVVKLLKIPSSPDNLLSAGVYIIPTKYCKSFEEVYDFYTQTLQYGLEGAIGKSFKNHFKDGTSTEQLKIKIEFEVDLVITGFAEGSGKNLSTFGSIEVETSDGLLKTKCSGMKDSVRKQMHLNRASYIGTIISVKGNDCFISENSPHYVISHCRFGSLRPDKSVADSLQKVLNELDAKRYLTN